MTKQDRQTFGMISFLLMYPDDEFWRQIEACQSTAAALPDGDDARCIAAFLKYLNAQPRIELQACYTAAFDMNPATTLNLTYHLWGENENRSNALVQIEQVYKDAGYARISGELPDYLPMMLEFLSIRPEAEGADHIWSCLRDLSAYRDRLRQEAPAYAALLQPLVRIVSGRVLNK